MAQYPGLSSHSEEDLNTIANQLLQLDNSVLNVNIFVNNKPIKIEKKAAAAPAPPKPAEAPSAPGHWAEPEKPVVSSDWHPDAFKDPELKRREEAELAEYHKHNAGADALHAELSKGEKKDHTEELHRLDKLIKKIDKQLELLHADVDRHH